MIRIGFVGLGHMGLPMAIHLVKAGHTVTGFDLKPEAINAFVSAGGLAASSLKEAAVDQQILITMLQTGQQVDQVCLSEYGLFAYASRDSLYMDCSSIDVQTSRDIHLQAAKKQLFVVDSPVSGGVAGATAGTLTFMVGGTEQAFAKAKSILAAMGKTIIHTGPAGSGQAAKICNNMILGISMIAISEAFVLAQHLGLSAKNLFEVVNNSSGQCWAMTNYIPVPEVLPNVPANHHYQPGFTVAMMLKDLYLSQNTATSVGIQTPLAALATDLYEKFNEMGQGQLDFSAIIKQVAYEK